MIKKNKSLFFENSKKKNIDTMNKQELDSYNRWLLYEFKKRTFQTNIPIFNFIKENFSTIYNSLPREKSVKYLKKCIWIDIDAIVTTFKLRDISNIQSNAIIYAFLYSYIDKKNKNKIINKYFCCGPSLLSKDGEYRQRLINYNSLDIIIKKYPILWNKLEEYMMKKIETLTWNYYTEYFYPTIKQQEFEMNIVHDIDNKRLPIKFLIISWFIELFNIVNNLPVNHINKLYTKIIGFTDKKIIESDKSFYNKLKHELGEKIIFNFRHDFNVYSMNDDSKFLKVGQKLIPLNISEVQNPFNITYKPWREFLISEKIQDLIINGICKGYPFIGDYFYVKDIRKTIFDNYVQYMKLEHSEQAIYITRKLIEAQMATYYTSEQPIFSLKKRKKRKMSIAQTGEKYKKIYKMASGSKKDKNKTDIAMHDSIEEISIWLSEKFKCLYQKINDPIEYSKKDLIMSEVAFGIISEFVGRSFYDFLMLNVKRESKFYIQETGDPLNDYHMWAKYIFECVYGLLCLNTRLGIIHGDLHLNNTTIHPMFYGDIIEIKKLDEEKKIPYMLYVIKSHEKSEEYTILGFKSRQYHTCIIDYSRSIIKPSYFEKYKDYNIIEAEKVKLYKDGSIQLLRKDDESKLHKDQILRVLTMLKYFFPEMIDKHGNDLEILLNHYFEKLFPILTALDIYRFTIEIKKYLSKQNKKDTKQYILIDSINYKAKYYLTDKLLTTLKNPHLLDEDTHNIYANLDIINEYFSEYIVMTTHKNEWKNSEFYQKVKNGNNVIIDVNFLHNDVIHSLNKYDEFPDFLKYVKLMNSSGKIELWNKKIPDPDKESRLKIEKEKKNNLKIISLIAARHKEKFF